MDKRLKFKGNKEDAERDARRTVLNASDINERSNPSSTPPPVMEAHWCAPGDDQQDRWLVRFGDNDMRDAIYSGPDAEKDAREKWNAWCGPSGNWNGYLFRLAARSNQEATPDAEVAMRVLTWVKRRMPPYRGIPFRDIEALAEASAHSTAKPVQEATPFHRSKEWWLAKANAEPGCPISAGVPDDRDALWSCQQLAASGIEATNDTGPLAEIFAEIHRTAAGQLASKEPLVNTVQEATALEGYRAAVWYISADSWDGCSDCMEILRSARSADFEWDWAGNPDKIAGALKSLRKRVSVQAELTRATKAIVDELERQGVAYGQVVVEALARAALFHTSSCGENK